MPEPKNTKSLNDVRKFAELVAEKQNWKLNPDEDFLQMLLEGLMINYNRYGYFSCPCRDASGIRENDRDILCPCAYCRPDQEEYGHCYCGLFLTIDFHASGKYPAPIPERRENN